MDQPPAMNAPAEVLLSVIVVNYNTAHLLDEMFAALKQAADGIAMQVIVVDNASRDDSVAHLRARHPDAELIANTGNVGFGRANNQALPRVRGRYVLLLNTDAFVAPDTLRGTLRFMQEHPRCGILGVRLVGRDGVLQPSCRYFPTPWNVFLSRTGLSRFLPRTRMVDDMAWDHASVRACDWVPGCYYLVRREVVDQVGLFDPRFFLYYEEVDHCRSAKQAGWEVVYFPDTTVVHIGGESAKTVSEITEAGRQISGLQIESEMLYFRKHYGPVGVAAAVALSMAGDVILALKWVLKRADLAGTRPYWKHLHAVGSSLLRTGWGTRPTR
jgi:N-acetylglucosaminyl-diphospho-decaprenol L-rhamnosyltransferase